ncbi:NADH:flavin oxidoreductase/NADH oxidase family protein [Citrobacter sp. R-1.5.2]|uniref:NADH:flavin oxidoreductase/NADH oxidase family protein n=1 Tax=Citrobacter sp. R-1.5.2 TaxID=3046183 RepID=UPI002B24B736|nr:NADH:flavin oxidoreductase/NADH oxidase family protein [Citrobacter sp. R-1.5.2]MEB2416692.1 NADH:flavin oxidoreductase/NADH oxidase family protein [Citrobacter sp. R-1.5.2]
MTNPLAQSLVLPCGAKLPNRLAKSAMSEGLADSFNHSTPKLETLYRRWAGSGAGLLLTGNIQVDRWHLERPGNIVIDDTSGRHQLADLARAGTSKGAHFWAQLGHTGRQVSDIINPAPLSCSDVEIDVIRNAGFSFAKPRPMSEAQIRHAIDQFAFAAREVKDAGFTGLSLHAAHGYLISQFLSPLSNRRTDEWGGSLENRSRFLFEVISAVRSVVGPAFPIGIKLNASDFQRGGFTNAECIELVKMLNDSSLDLLELSGGSLEQPKVVGIAVKDEGEDGVLASSSAREAYFVAFAGAVRNVAKMPIMVTGNFRSVTGMLEALEAGELDVIGIGRPLIADPEAPSRLLAGAIERLPSPEAKLNLFHILPWNNMQLERLGNGLDPDLSMSGETASVAFSELEGGIMAALLAQRQIL